LQTIKDWWKFQQKKIMLKTVFQRLFLSFSMHFNIFFSLAFSISLCKIIKHNKVISNFIFSIKKFIANFMRFLRSKCKVQGDEFAMKKLERKKWWFKNWNCFIEVDGKPNKKSFR
jgi:hypothetical protein